MYVFSLNIAFSCINVLSHSFEIWLSNDNRLSIVIPKRVTEFSDLILLLHVSSNVSFFWMQLKLYCHRQNCKYQNPLIPLASH